MNSWRDVANKVLVGLRLEPCDPDAKQKVFDAYPFGMRKYHPYKIWLSEVHKVYPWLRPKKVKSFTRGMPEQPNLFKPQQDKGGK
jgi:hypothetical protein